LKTSALSLYAKVAVLVRMVQAYCVKCKKKVEIKDPMNVTLKNKRLAVRGVCPTCGTKVFKLGKA